MKLIINGDNGSIEEFFDVIQREDGRVKQDTPKTYRVSELKEYLGLEIDWNRYEICFMLKQSDEAKSIIENSINDTIEGKSLELNKEEFKLNGVLLYAFIGARESRRLDSFPRLLCLSTYAFYQIMP